MVSRRTHAFFVLSVFVCLPLSAGFSGKELILPAIGRIDGAGGSHFYTTVWVTNPTAATAGVQIDFLAAGQPNPNPPSVSDSLAPGQTKVYENIAESLFGMKGVIGAARFRSSADIVVSARIYNLPDGGSAAISDGEFFSAVRPEFAIGAGETSFLQGLRVTPDFRYNVIFVETTGGAVSGHLRITDANGVVVAESPLSLGAFEERLVGVASLLPAGAVLNDGSLTFGIDGGSGRVLVAGSLLTNGSQNAAGFEMAFRPALLAANAPSSAITSIVAGAGLTGGGSSGDVGLAVAPRGIVASMLARNAVTGPAIADGQVVRSINGVTDAVTLNGGANVSVDRIGNTITINAAAPTNVLQLSGDVSGPSTATTVARIGGAAVARSATVDATNASNISSGTLADARLSSGVQSALTTIGGATSAATANAIVRRDASGNFSAGTITANLNGNATTATTATTATSATTATTATTALTATSATTATNFTGPLSGDVTGTQSATTIAPNAVTEAKIATGNVVKSLNGLRDGVTIAAGPGTTVSSSSGTVTISANSFASTAYRNPKQIALGAWWAENETPAIAQSPSIPQAMTYDGYAIWVANSDGTIRQYRASDMTLLQTISGVTNAPRGICYDGQYIWVSNHGDSTVKKIRASDGAVVYTYAAPFLISGIVYDGQYIWVANSGNHIVFWLTRIGATTGSILDVYPYSGGTNASYLAFDGTYIWAASNLSVQGLAKYAQDGSLAGSWYYSPQGITFDGSHIWISLNQQLVEVDSNGNTVRSVSLPGMNPTALAFDGVYVWATVPASDKVVKVRVSDGTSATYSACCGPQTLAFDGASMWVGGSNGLVLKK